ncbi:MAG TPA: histidine triad nucleotide-binding protein [Ramlibacter sp.]|nr:histidine triad nucleotide-binding protein [Ramlibacter sp.]
MSSADPSCIFCKIIEGTIPSRKVYEDADMLVFHDIHPWAPVHFLMVPKAHIASLAQVGAEHEGLLGRMLALAPKLALQEGCRPYPEGGHRVVINTGVEGGQEVHHLHVHVMGGPRPWLRG